MPMPDFSNEKRPVSGRVVEGSNLLRVAGVSLDIDGKRLIDGIDLTLKSNSVTVILGPNGAGKSLFVRLLHGLIEPTGGAIEWLRENANRQAMVFQKPVLLRRSVAANIDFVLRLQGPVDRGHRNEILEHVGLLDHAGQAARLLSGGEQQRLALARALATEPDILFLDEPTASLDPASVARIEDIVVNAHRGGTKVIFITHDIGQARRLADDVVFMNRGRIEEHSPAHRFFEAPACPGAQAYLEGRIVL